MKYRSLMTFIGIYSSLGLASLTKEPAYLVAPIKALATSNTHTCLIDANGGHCFGDNFFGQSPNKISHLAKPTQVAVGQKFSCFLDQEGVKCFGKIHKNEAPKQIPLSGITHIAGTKDRLVLVDSTTLHFLGKGDKFNLKGPYNFTKHLGEEKIIGLFTNKLETCIHTEVSSLCLNHKDGDVDTSSNSFFTKETERVLRAEGSICIQRKDKALDCDSDNGKNELQKQVKGIETPYAKLVDFSMGIGAACVIEKPDNDKPNTAKCYGKRVSRSKHFLEIQNDPQQVFLSKDLKNIFLVEKDRLHGHGKYFKLDVSESLKTSTLYPVPSIPIKTGTVVDVRMTNLKYYLDYLSKHVYVAKKEYLIKLATLFSESEENLGELETLKRLYIFRSLGEFVRGQDSPNFTQNFIPSFEVNESQVNDHYGHESLRSIKQNKDFLILAGNVLKISMQTVKRYLPTERDKKSHQRIMASLGRFLSSKGAQGPRKKLIQELKKHKDFFQKISFNPRVKGIGSLMQLQIEYIKDL